MASYGVPRELEGALPWEWAEERLLANHNYWVVTVDPQGRPHSTPVWGVWMADEDRFWFSCAEGSLKARNLASNPNVVVTTADTVEMVSVEGTAALAPLDSSRAQSVAEAYAAKYESDPDKQAALAEFVLGTALHVVEPAKAFGIIEHEEQFAATATRWAW
jgi:general stress protein 26